MAPEQGRNILHKIQNDRYSFGQSMRCIRQAQGISLRKVAGAVNKTPTYISDIERGEVSGDITEYIMSQTELRKLIRLALIILYKNYIFKETIT